MEICRSHSSIPIRIRTLAILLAAALSLIAGAPVAADDDDLPGALSGSLPDKPKYPRLDSQLNRLAAQAAESGQGGGDVITTSALMYSGTSVAVTVHLSSGSDAIAAFITEGGGIAATVGEDYVEAYVPPSILAALSELVGVLRVDTILPPQPDILSQGRASHGVPAWNTRGLTGAGVKVGIIDSGFEGFATLMGTELPSTVVARCYTSIGVFTPDLADCENGSVHGTAVAEAIIDIAPQVALYVANQVSRADGVAIATWMTEQGVTVINRSLASVWQGPGDGTSPFSNSDFTMIDAAVAGGALFANSAGNSAEDTWYGSFVDSEPDGFHEFFEGDETNEISASQGQELIIELRWDDAWGGASKDLDLELYDASLSLVDSSENEQSGDAGHTPYERINYVVQTSGTYHVIVSRFDGAAPSWLQIKSFSGQKLEYATAARSINTAGESFNAGLLAVGATPWFDDDAIETFSSQGPTIDGRTKPDIVGVDQGNSSTYGPSGFAGTSQASPHVAGLAALVKQNFPSFTPAQTATYLKANALARGTAPNNTWGFGLAHLPAIEPGAPTGVAATPDDGQASVTWNAPADGGSAITGFTVTASPGGNIAAVNGSTLSAVVTGLANGTGHTFTVTATNAIGTGEASSPSSTVTPSGPPDAPTGVAAVAGDGLAAVSWTASSFDGGSPIISYNVTSTPGGLTATVGGSTLSAVVTGLSNGTSYVFNVSASNAVGSSGASVSSTTTTPIGPPLAPFNVTAVPGNTEAAVSWSAPSDGGNPITLYNIVSDPEGLSVAVNGTERTGLVTDLTNGTAYTFTVTALNALGSSPPSTASSSVVPRRLPDAPNNVRAIAGDESATISWNAPDDGGSPILQYNVSSTPDALGVTVDGSTLSATVTGLTNFVGYTFTVTAVNVVGSGLPSAPSNEVTPPNDPPEVTASANTSGDEGALLSLQLASFTDSDVADTHTASVDWGDGTTSTAAVTESGGSGTVSASHTYDNNGTNIVAVTVTDSFGSTQTVKFTLTVNNLAPTVFAGSALSTAGSSITFPNIHFTDPGIQDTHSAAIDWGDGATSTAFVIASRRFVRGSHTYSTTGQFTVTLTVTDDDGDSGSDTLTIDVTSAPVAVSIPSLSTWGLVAMAMALVAMFAVRRRSFDRFRANGR